MAELGNKIGPVRFEPGVSSKHVLGLAYAALFSIGLATGITVLTPYVLSANLGLGTGEQGTAISALAVSRELALIFAYAIFGAMADKIGRRTVYVLGLVLSAAAYGAFAYGTSMTELIIYQVIFAFGVGAVTGMLATIIADYSMLEDRGKATAFSGILNGLGIVVVAIFLAKLPALFVAQGQGEMEAGQSAMAVMAGVALASAVVLWLLLKPGVPPQTAARKPFGQLLREGFGAAKSNRRIAISYAAAFVARGDLAVVGLFSVAWGNLAAQDAGFSVAEAADKGTLPFIIAQSAALLWPVVIAVPLDRMARMKALGLTMLLGFVGYCLLIFVDDPLAPIAIPFFILLGIGQISAFLGAQTTIGKEAPGDMRGSVIGVFNFCGALGILVLTGIGGILFDQVGPWAPFFLVGLLNGAIGLLCWWQLRSESQAGTAHA